MFCVRDLNFGRKKSTGTEPNAPSTIDILVHRTQPLCIASILS